MGLANIAELGTAYDRGRTHVCSFRKVPSQATVAGWWADLSMASGNPPPNYYAATPLTSKTLDAFDGIWHGDARAPASTYLTGLGLMSATAGMVGRYELLDYLLYYPFIDCDEGSEQTMVNTVPLPRYADGNGVQVMAVAVAPTTGGGQFTFDYINQDGVLKVSPMQYCSTTAANIATIVTSQQALASTFQPAGPFLKLAAGDSGVREIRSATFWTLNGGLIALVLVKPLATLAIREINTMNEVNFVRMKPALPEIVDGAYLNLVVNTSATIAAGVLAGYASFAWSDD